MKNARLKNAILRSLPGALYGGIYGSLVGLVGTELLNKKDLETVKRLNKENLVDPSKIIAEYGDGIKYVKDKRNLKGTNLSPISRFGIKKILKNKKLLEGNAFYVPTKSGKALILSKDSANKFLVGHEIGHHYDFKDKDIKNKLRRLFRTTMTREKEGWKRSPFAGQPGESELKDPALRTYKRIAIYPTIGAVSGAAIGSQIPRFINLAKKLKK